MTISRDVGDLIRHLFRDGELRQRFITAPDSVLAGRAISRDERRALLRLRTRWATAGGPAGAEDPPIPIAWP